MLFVYWLINQQKWLCLKNTKDTPIYTQPQIIKRVNTIKNYHIINDINLLSEEDLYIGLIDEYGQSNLSIYNPQNTSYSSQYLNIYSELIALHEDTIEDNFKIYFNNNYVKVKLVSEDNSTKSNVKVYLNGEIKHLQRHIT